MNLKALLASAAIALAPLSALAQAVAPVGDNLLVNPWMELDQDKEGASITVTRQAAGTFALADYIPLGDGNWNGYAAQSSSSSPTVLMQNAAAAPNGSIVDMKFTENATVSSTHADGTLQVIEQHIDPFKLAALQYGTANAQTTYLSFCAKASVAGTYGFYVAGGLSSSAEAVAAGTGTSGGSTYFHAFSIPTAAQWSCYQFPIPGDTGGTWVVNAAQSAGVANYSNSTGASLGFVLSINGVTTTAYGTPTATAADGVWYNTAASGSLQNVIGNNTTYVALEKTASATFELTGVKWSVNAAPLVHNPALELVEAQRYYAKTFTVGMGGVAGTAPAQNAGVAHRQFVSSHVDATATPGGVYWQFPVNMSAAPTITRYDPSASDTNCVDLAHTATTSASTIEPNTTSHAINTNGVYIGCATSIANAAGDEIALGIKADARF